MSTGSASSISVKRWSLFCQVLHASSTRSRSSTGPTGGPAVRVEPYPSRARATSGAVVSVTGALVGGSSPRRVDTGTWSSAAILVSTPA
ncbi:hypothetical protein, partial [Streptomyces niveus]